MTPQGLWWMRAGLRVGALAVALCLPLVLAGLISGTAILILVLCVGAVCIDLLFWLMLTLWLTSARQTGAYNLTIMLGVWLLVCAVTPATLTQIIERVVPLPEGGEIVLTQREAVNDAWDLPRETTYEPFFERHPEWADKAAWSEDGFEWKWYYAFQQVGDQTAEVLSQAYRDGRAQRDAMTRWSSLISPATLLQRTIENLAGTDMLTAIAYEEHVRDFHANLRTWYYPKMFNSEGYDVERAMRELPVYEANPKTGL